jgi:hypothetical protein
VWIGDFSQTRTRRFEDHPNGADARFASLRGVDLGETPECKLPVDRCLEQIREGKELPSGLAYYRVRR